MFDSPYLPAMSVTAPDRYLIHLPQFEGPFDLLLFFIERDELDIYDIPIAKITDDFLDYVRAMEALNIDLASEFILVAASLMRIKSKMLLPRKELDDEGNEIDPREELVQRLIEYKRYKEVMGSLREMEADRRERLERGYAGHELEDIAEHFSTEAELHNLDLYQLLKAFHRVLNRVNERPDDVVHTVVRYHYTIRDEKDRILQRATGPEPTSFETLFAVCTDRMHAIFAFLAVLELVQEKMLELRLGEGVNNFWVRTASSG